MLRAGPVTLNEKGRRCLVALLRYVEQHGNVTRDAIDAAAILRAAFSDHALLQKIPGIPHFSVDGKASTQAELRDALADLLKKRTETATGSPGATSTTGA